MDTSSNIVNDLAEVFHACHIYIQEIRGSPEAVTLSPHLDILDETFQWASVQFWPNQQNASLLLVSILQRMYELLRRSAEEQDLTIFAPSSLPPVQPPDLVSHGQVHVLLENVVDGLDIQSEDRERIEEYVERVQQEINRATRKTVSLEKTLTGLEIWSDQLAALTLYVAPRFVEDLKSSVGIALAGIKNLLDNKIVILSSSKSVTSPQKSDMFLWEELKKAEDGFGKVYKIRAKDVSWTGDYYACKVIRQTRISGAPSIYAERQTILQIAKYHHLNIVDIVDIWTEEEGLLTICYIQMELCAGDLSTFLWDHYANKPQSPLTELQVWDYFGQIMAGLKFLHSQGILHSNLKPRNVLYSITKDQGLAWKLTDFGFSSPATTVSRKPGIIGRLQLNYCAPELLLSSTYDRSADIWSAGCILYELATGLPAFATGDAIRTYAWERASAPLVSDIRQDLRKAVDDMVAQMLNARSDRRPDAVNVCEAIERIQGVKTELEVSELDVRRIDGCDAGLGPNR